MGILGVAGCLGCLRGAPPAEATAKAEPVAAASSVKSESAPVEESPAGAAKETTPKETAAAEAPAIASDAPARVGADYAARLGVPQPASRASKSGLAAGARQNLAHAEAALARGQLAAAQKLLDSAQASQFSERDRERFDGLSAAIRLHAAAGAKPTPLTGLASGDLAGGRSAEEAIFQRGDAAIPELLAALQGSDEAVAAQALGLLARLERRDVLQDACWQAIAQRERRKLWPAALDYLQQAPQPGLGARLLELALKSDDAEQRRAALAALADASDPPRETFFRLLPGLFDDGPALAEMLLASARAILLHGQNDVASQRAWDDSADSQSGERLAALPARLQALAASDSANAALAGTARAARMLAYALGQAPAEAIAGVRVHSVGGELPDSLAPALFDGRWQSLDPKEMWRYPLSRPGVLVLDLGAERVVTGVRLWNLNESGVQRGWKDVAISVARGPASFGAIAAVGRVPASPAATSPANYSTLISLPCSVGRYMRLVPRSLWKTDAHSGLAEVEVLGF